MQVFGFFTGQMPTMST